MDAGNVIAQVAVGKTGQPSAATKEIGLAVPLGSPLLDFAQTAQELIALEAVAIEGADLTLIDPELSEMPKDLSARSQMPAQEVEEKGTTESVEKLPVSEDAVTVTLEIALQKPAKVVTKTVSPTVEETVFFARGSHFEASSNLETRSAKSIEVPKVPMSETVVNGAISRALDIGKVTDAGLWDLKANTTYPALIAPSSQVQDDQPIIDGQYRVPLETSGTGKAGPTNVTPVEPSQKYAVQNQQALAFEKQVPEPAQSLGSSATATPQTAHAASAVTSEVAKTAILPLQEQISAMNMQQKPTDRRIERTLADDRPLLQSPQTSAKTPLTKSIIALHYQNQPTGIPDTVEGKGFKLDAIPSAEFNPQTAIDTTQLRNTVTQHPPTALTTYVARQLAEAMPHLSARQMTISLSPDELGKVRMSLAPSETGLVVSVMAERPETMDLLRRHIGELDQEFRAMGYENVAFSFEESPSQNDKNNSRGDAFSETSNDTTDTIATSTDTVAHLSIGNSANLDIRL